MTDEQLKKLEDTIRRIVREYDAIWNGTRPTGVPDVTAFTASLPSSSRILDAQLLSSAIAARAAGTASAATTAHRARRRLPVHRIQ